MNMTEVYNTRVVPSYAKHDGRRLKYKTSVRSFVSGSFIFPKAPPIPNLGRNAKCESRLKRKLLF